MAAYAKRYFELNLPAKDGLTLRGILEERIRRAKLKNAKANVSESERALKMPVMPILVRHVWEWFGELQREREYAGMGAALPLSSYRIKGWAELYGRNPRKIELFLLRMLDDIYLTKQAEMSKD